MKKVQLGIYGLFALLALSAALVFSCQKQQDVSKQIQNSSVTNRDASTSQKSVTFNSTSDTSHLTEAEKQQLIQQYGLVPLSAASLPSGFVAKTVNSLQEGQNFLDSAKAFTNGSTSGYVTVSRSGGALSTTKQGKISNRAVIGNTLAFREGDCSGGSGYATVGFGLFSTITFDFSYGQNANGQWYVDNTSSHVNGLTVGIGWQQWGTPQNYSTTSTVDFCLNGTATAGIDMGGTTYGWQSDYHYRLRFDPCTLRGTMYQGYGRCH